VGENIYTLIYDLLSSGQKLVLARIIRRSGSTPRDVGSMCIITQKDKLIGTVGGGPLEYQVQKRALELLDQEKSFIYKFELNEEDLANAGMICGGSADLYLEVLSPENHGTLSLFKAIKDHIIHNKPSILVTKIKDGVSAMDTETRVFIKKDRTTLGSISGFDLKQIDLDKDIAGNLISSKDQNTHFFVERVAMNPEIFLFGAGHVSMFVSKLAKVVDFNITVIDDRAEFANEQKFPDADNILVAPFDKAFGQLTISQNSYILIFTRGHLFDKVVLQHALGTDAAYIGMIGSIRKRNTIYEALMDEGVSQESLEKVFSPIGIDIDAETPEEIAVSIVGELIKKRAPKKKKKKMLL